jgi:serine protease Do
MLNKTRENKILFMVLLLAIGVITGLLIAAKLDLSPRANALAPADEEVASKGAATGFENAFINVAGNVGKAVVSISTEQTTKVGTTPGIRRYYFRGTPQSNRDFGDDFFNHFFDDFFGNMPEREFKQRGLGSGVIINQDGYILTNEHVVRGADKITVTLPDGREFKGTVKGTDVRSDLAVVQIKANDLPMANLGNSDNIKIGQWVVAIGNPFAYMIHSPEPTVTVGVVSALHRSLLGSSMQERDYSDLIQTDAAINPGNSGGPLVNLNGEIIGVNVAIFSTTGGYQGVGFAIPSNVAKKILSRLIEGKKITYGWLGVSVQNIDDKLAAYFGLTTKEGALVTKVLKGGPAEKAGMKDGDVILSFDGRKIKKVQELVKLAGNTEVGTKVKIGILRDKKPKEVEAVTGPRPAEEEGSATAPQSESEEGQVKFWRGIAVEEITPEMAKQNGLEESEGVVITEIGPSGPADEVGLGVGDIISEINKKPVKNLKDYQAATKGAKGDCLIKTNRGYIVLPEK